MHRYLFFLDSQSCAIMGRVRDLETSLLIILSLAALSLASLISSSQITTCGRDKRIDEPLDKKGKKCTKKFVVNLAVASEQGVSNSFLL